MPAATIVFMDIVGFSKKPDVEQHRLVEALNAELIHELRPLLSPPTGPPRLLALPTGDGVALAFIHNSSDRWPTILKLILRLQRWAWKLQNLLRFGVHVGSVELITDINGRSNVCGDTINYAQRVMDAAGGRQVLLSDSAYNAYIGSETKEIRSDGEKEYRFVFAGPIEVYAKHGRQIQVYKLDTAEAEEWWSNEDPVGKDLMVVRLTRLPKEIKGTFGQGLQQANEVALIQLTGERLLNALENGSTVLSQSLKRLHVFMPEPDLYPDLKTASDQTYRQVGHEYILKWRGFLQKTQVAYPNAHFKLAVFPEPPYFGASFLDWERPEGKIHVSPYIWGVAAPNCPGYDLQWIGRAPSSVYEAYVDGLRNLDASTENLLTKPIGQA